MTEPTHSSDAPTHERCGGGGCKPAVTHLADGRLLLPYVITEEDCEPTKAHEDDAMYDLRTREEYLLGAGDRHIFPVGIRTALPTGYFAMVCSRSGLATKHGVIVLNAPGIIDAGYRGEWRVTLINLGHTPYLVRRGDKIAQTGVHKCVPTVLYYARALPDDSTRGERGIGSSGR
jgi:dUTP pyrophosphatase